MGGGGGWGCVEGGGGGGTMEDLGQVLYMDSSTVFLSLTMDDPVLVFGLFTSVLGSHVSRHYIFPANMLSHNFH